MKTLHIFILLFMALAHNSCSEKKEASINKENEGIAKIEAAGLKLAMHSGTYSNLSLVEALDKTREMGVKYMEIAPGHILGGKWGNKKFDYNLTSEEQQEILELASSKSITIVGCGLFGAADEKDWEHTFQLAKGLHLEYITGEPKLEHLDLIERLAIETDIKVSIHNSIRPSNYWNPNVLLDVIENRDMLIGSCMDAANWSRSGLDYFESLELLEGRIISVHLYDIHHPIGNPEQDEAIIGYGMLDIDAIVKELKRQQFVGYLAIKYNPIADEPFPNLEDCVDYFEIMGNSYF